MSNLKLKRKHDFEQRISSFFFLQIDENCRLEQYLKTSICSFILLVLNFLWHLVNYTHTHTHTNTMEKNTLFDIYNTVTYIKMIDGKIDYILTNCSILYSRII